MPKKYRAARVGLAGAIGGPIEICCTYPLEFAKTQLQLEHGAASTHTGFRKGTLDCLATTLKQKGFFGLYRGATPWFIGAGPRSAIRFVVYDCFREEGFSWFMSGVVAGSAEALLAQTPMQAIQIKMVHDLSAPVKRFQGMNFFQICADILRKEGFVDGFYCGAGPAVAKGAVTTGVRFYWYRLITNEFSPRERPSIFMSLMAGGFAGAFSAVVSQPIDTVKANMMGLDRHRYTSSFDCATQIVRSDGICALWNGVDPRMGRVCIEVALQFTLFEQISMLIFKL